MKEMENVLRKNVIKERNESLERKKREVEDMESKDIVREMKKSMEMKKDKVDIVRMKEMLVKEIMKRKGMEKCKVMIKMKKKEGKIGNVFDGERIEKKWFKKREKKIRIINRGRREKIYKVLEVGRKKRNVDKINRGEDNK